MSVLRSHLEYCLCLSWLSSGEAGNLPCPWQKASKDIRLREPLSKHLYVSLCVCMRVCVKGKASPQLVRGLFIFCRRRRTTFPTQVSMRYQPQSRTLPYCDPGRPSCRAVLGRLTF